MIGTPSRRFDIRTLIIVSILAALLGSALTFGGIAARTYTDSTVNRQTMVHAMGTNVMPFDLERTTHIFIMTQTGGVQQVVTKSDTDAAQVALIQQHLQHEAQRFGSGDFSDPSTLHGLEMPGISVLSSHASALTIRYTPLATGGQITYTTDDITLITAIHQWFGAQLNDHGRDATSKAVP